MISTQVNNVLCPKAYLVNNHHVKGLHPLPPLSLTFTRCPPLKPLPPLRIANNAVRCRQAMPVCLSGGEASVGSGNQDPLWKSFGKAIENLGKKPSVEDVLKQQIEKREFYDEGGNPPGGAGGSSGGGGGGFGDFGESEEDGLSGVLEETIQVILATLGFIFLYLYIINGAEILRLGKDYIKYVFTGKKSIRLSNTILAWKKFWRSFKPKKKPDNKWLEKAIITTPTWWDSPQKYKRLLRAYVRERFRQSNDQKTDNEYAYK